MKDKKCLMGLLAALLMTLFIWGGNVTAYAASGYTIYVNRSSNIINVVNSRSGRVARAMYCSTGRGYSTIRGTYNTVSKMRWHMLQGGVWGQYCTRIHGPYLFHSVYYYRTAKNQLSVKEYNKLGFQASAGCVRLAVVDAKWIYDHCSVGTRVVIGESRKMVKPSRPLFRIRSSSSRGWDPTDPDPANPYRPMLKLKKSAPKVLEYGSKFNPRKLIRVRSKLTPPAQLLKCVKVKGKVKTRKPGKYKIVYTVTDPRSLLTRSLTVRFKVRKKPGEKVAPNKTPAETPS